MKKTSLLPLFLRLFTIILLLVLSGALARADVKIWKNDTAESTDFNDADNWTGGLPTAADIARFNDLAFIQPELTASISVLGLDFSDSSLDYLLTATNNAVLTLMSTDPTAGLAAISGESSFGATTISAALNLGASAGATQTFLQAEGGTLTVNGIISGGGATNTLSLAGGGDFQLNGANTFTGTTTIGDSTGTVVVGHKSAFGAAANTLNIAGTKALQAGADLSGANKIAQNVTVGANLTIADTPSFAVEFGGNVNLGGAARTIVNNNTGSDGITPNVSGTTFSGVISNDGGQGVNFGGTGITRLTQANTYTGNTTLSGGGSLVLGNIGALGANSSNNTIIFNGSKAIQASTSLTGVNKLNHSISLSSNMTIAQGSAIEFGGNVNLGGVARSITSNVNGGTAPSNGAIFSGVIGNDGGLGVTFDGSGITRLNNANSYTGPTTFAGSGGSVYLGTLNAISANTINITGTKTLVADVDFTGSNKFTQNVFVSSNFTLNLTGNFGFEFGGTMDLMGGARTITSTSVAAINAATIFSGNITNDGGLGVTFAGNGVVRLMSANSYTGSTTFTSNGVRYIGNLNALGTNDSSNLLIINGGSIASTFPFTGVNKLNHTVRLTGAGLTLLGGSPSPSQQIDFAGPIDLNGGDRLITINNAATGGAIFSGNIGNGGKLTIGGNGPTVLSGNNTYTGATELSGGGTLTLSSVHALGSPDEGDPVANQLIINSGSTAKPIIATVDLTGANRIKQNISLLLNSDKAFTINNGSAIEFSGNMTLNGAARQIANNNLNAAGVTFSGVISGDGGAGISFIQVANVITTLSGQSTFTGAPNLSGGIFKVSNLGNVGSPSNLGTNSTINFGTVVTGTSSTTLNYKGAGETSNKTIRLNHNGGVTTIDTTGATGALILTSDWVVLGNGAAKTLALKGDTAGNRISGVIPNPASGNVAVTKSGTGTWILGGANTYSGNTTISGGTLLLDNASGSATGLGNVIVSTSGILGGGNAGGTRGFVTGLVTVNNTGHIAPGLDDIGALTLNGGLTLTAGSFLDFELGTPGELNASDLLKITSGTFTGTAGSQQITFNASYLGEPVTPGDYTYTVIDWTGATPSGVDVADFKLAGSLTGSFNIVGSTLQLTVALVPEPGTTALLLMGGLAVAVRFFRRKR